MDAIEAVCVWAPESETCPVTSLEAGSLYLPLTSVDPRIVWLRAPGVSWVSGETGHGDDQWSSEPLSLPGAEPGAPLHLFGDGFPTGSSFSAHRPLAHPCRSCRPGASPSKYTLVLTWFTLLKKDLMAVRFFDVTLCTVNIFI